MLDPRFQPSLESLLRRLSEEISARAVILLHENGQVLHRHGWVEDHEYPAMAALIAAMIAASKSLGSLGENFADSPNRFGCDSNEVGLYTVLVNAEVWLAALYDQPLNPGQLRMKVRRYAETCARLGTEKSEEWDEVTENGTNDGARVSPPAAPGATLPEKFIGQNPSLFTNITDDEIDRLFEEARG